MSNGFAVHFQIAGVPLLYALLKTLEKTFVKKSNFAKFSYVTKETKTKQKLLTDYCPCDFITYNIYLRNIILRNFSVSKRAKTMHQGAIFFS